MEYRKLSVSLPGTNSRGFKKNSDLNVNEQIPVVLDSEGIILQINGLCSR